MKFYFFILDPVLVPSLLPSITALNIRHLLQHQPWCKKSQNIPSIKNENLLIDIASSSQALTCDQTTIANTESDQSSYSSSDCSLLAPGFAKIQNSVNIFLYGLKTRYTCDQIFSAFSF